MALSTQPMQTQDVLQKVQIRTMRKDIKRVREGDTIIERDKISRISPVEFVPPAPKPVLPPPAVFQQAVQDVPSPAGPTQEHIVKAEQMMEEISGQHSQTPQAPLSAPLAPENTLLSQQQDWQKKLAAITQEERQNVEQQRIIKEKESVSIQPQEKQNLEKERWALEDKERDIEKKRWFIEEELAKLETPQPDKSQGHFDGPVTIPPKADLVGEREYFQKMAPAAKEKLASNTAIEQQERRKFMEDVENWANEEKQNLAPKP